MHYAKLLPLGLLATLAAVLLLAGGPTPAAANAKACKWIGGKTGWFCDDPVSRGVWRGYQRLRHGVRNCNDLCVKVNKRRSGRCVGRGNYDRSTWCPRGQTCKCF